MGWEIAAAVLLIVLAPAQGTTSDDRGVTKPTTARPGDWADPIAIHSRAPCAAPCEPNSPSPVEGATDVPVDTLLSWDVPAPKGCDGFRVLASTGGIDEGLNPFSLIELATDPVSEVPIGRAHSIGFVASLDFSPNGFIYAVDNVEWRLYKINPSKGLVVDEFGPYGSELWGVASECLLPSCSGQATAVLIPSLHAASTAGWQMPQEPAGLWRAAGDELTTTMKRGLMLERLALRSGKIAGEDGARVATAGETSPSLQAAAAEVGSDITCDVYLDTVRPPAVRTCYCGASDEL